MKGKCFPIIPFISSSKHFNQSDFANSLEKLPCSWHFLLLLSFPWDPGGFTKTLFSGFHRLDRQHFPSLVQYNRYLDAASRNANLSLENEADMLAMSTLHLMLLYPCSCCRLQGASRLLQGCPCIGRHCSYVRKRNQTFWLWKHFQVHICATLCVSRCGFVPPRHYFRKHGICIVMWPYSWPGQEFCSRSVIQYKILLLFLLA